MTFDGLCRAAAFTAADRDGSGTLAVVSNQTLASAGPPPRPTPHHSSSLFDAAIRGEIRAGFNDKMTGIDGDHWNIWLAVAEISAGIAPGTKCATF